MVERDHSSVVSLAAFFKESMRRDAMIGRNAACDLWDPSWYQSLRGCFCFKEGEDLHPRQELDLRLNMHKR